VRVFLDEMERKVTKEAPVRLVDLAARERRVMSAFLVLLEPRVPKVFLGWMESLASLVNLVPQVYLVLLVLLVPLEQLVQVVPKETRENPLRFQMLRFLDPKVIVEILVVLVSQVCLDRMELLAYLASLAFLETKVKRVEVDFPV